MKLLGNAFSERICASELKATFYKRYGTAIDNFKCFMSSYKWKKIAYHNIFMHIANVHYLLEAELSGENLTTFESIVKSINNSHRDSNTKPF